MCAGCVDDDVALVGGVEAVVKMDVPGGFVVVGFVEEGCGGIWCEDAAVRSYVMASSFLVDPELRAHQMLLVDSIRIVSFLLALLYMPHCQLDFSTVVSCEILQFGNLGDWSIVLGAATGCGLDLPSHCVHGLDCGRCTTISCRVLLLVKS